MSELLMKETSLQRVMRASGRVPIQCMCSQCKNQCRTPCLGTPEDIERIIDAGYADRLALTQWAAGIFIGVINVPVPMIQPVARKEYCAFLENGLCILHDKGLKPTEGRLSHHTIKKDNFNPAMSIAWNVTKEWLMPENREVISRILKKFVNARNL